MHCIWSVSYINTTWSNTSVIFAVGVFWSKCKVSTRHHARPLYSSVVQCMMYHIVPICRACPNYIPVVPSTFHMFYARESIPRVQDQTINTLHHVTTQQRKCVSFKSHFFHDGRPQQPWSLHRRYSYVLTWHPCTCITLHNSKTSVVLWYLNTNLNSLTNSSNTGDRQDSCRKWWDYWSREAQTLCTKNLYPAWYSFCYMLKIFTLCRVFGGTSIMHVVLAHAHISVK